jgi:hypothetical protein
MAFLRTRLVGMDSGDESSFWDTGTIHILLFTEALSCLLLA